MLPYHFFLHFLQTTSNIFVGWLAVGYTTFVGFNASFTFFPTQYRVFPDLFFNPKEVGHSKHRTFKYHNTYQLLCEHINKAALEAENQPLSTGRTRS